MASGWGNQSWAKRVQENWIVTHRFHTATPWSDPIDASQERQRPKNLLLRARTN